MFYFLFEGESKTNLRNSSCNATQFIHYNNRIQWSPSSITEKSILRKPPPRNILHGAVKGVRLETQSAHNKPEHRSSAQSSN